MIIFIIIAFALFAVVQEVSEHNRAWKRRNGKSHKNASNDTPANVFILSDLFGTRSTKTARKELKR